MKTKLLFLGLSFFLLSLFSLFSLQKTTYASHDKICVCSANCGGGILQCLSHGKLTNEGPCNTQSCNPSCVNTSWSCGACSKSCGGGTQYCTSNCGETGTFGCNSQSCGQPPPRCGDGSCRPGVEFCSTCPQDCGTCPPPPTPPPTPSPTPGMYQINETCNSAGTGWDITNTQCVRSCITSTPTPTPLPDCNTGKSCGSCGVQCGNGSRSCSYTRHPDGSCRQVSFSEPCSEICPPGNSCVAQACIVTGDPWIQSVGGSLRLDEGFVSKVPATAVGGPYASLPGSGGTPGLIFTGDSTPDFGSGQSSQTPYNWVVGGTLFPNLYAPVRQGGIVKTSYAFLLAKANQGSITPENLADYCAGGLSNCRLLPNISSGVYKADGNVILREEGNRKIFRNNVKIVILIDGDLRIETNVEVPTTSYVIFSASGNITVDRGVGETLVQSTSSNIEGVYSADRNFIVDGINNCTSGIDRRLNVGGHVIANATLSGGSFQNQRNLCVSNQLYPSIYFKERPDFILNTPHFVKQPNFTYQEIAP